MRCSTTSGKGCHAGCAALELSRLHRSELAQPHGPSPFSIAAALAQVTETEEEQQARLERFAAELEAGGAAGAEPAEQ